MTLEIQFFEAPWAIWFLGFAYIVAAIGVSASLIYAFVCIKEFIALIQRNGA